MNIFQDRIPRSGRIGKGDMIKLQGRNGIQRFFSVSIRQVPKPVRVVKAHLRLDDLLEHQFRRLALGSDNSRKHGIENQVYRAVGRQENQKRRQQNGKHDIVVAHQACPENRHPVFLLGCGDEIRNAFPGFLLKVGKQVIGLYCGKRIRKLAAHRMVLLQFCIGSVGSGHDDFPACKGQERSARRCRRDINRQQDTVSGGQQQADQNGDNISDHAGNMMPHHPEDIQHIRIKDMLQAAASHLIRVITAGMNQRTFDFCGQVRNTFSSQLIQNHIPPDFEEGIQ